jgi:2-(1,2-epoxy-1,2-dihydrophenyl)acetyl-CoA isomerase
MYNTINLDINDNIAIITLARKEAMNAFNPEMGGELLHAFTTIEADHDVRAVLLRGDGKVFCVGGDIRFFAEKLDTMPANIPDTMEVMNTLITTMRSLKKPILASVHGSVAGIGLSFLMACDLAIAAKNTQFTLAYAGIGLTPDGGASYFLPRLVGQRMATQMMFLPELMSAERALELTLLNWVVDDEKLDETTTKIMYQLANGPTLVYGRAKELLEASWSNNLEDQLTQEMHVFTESTISGDFRIGVESFLKKSAPVFEGS